MFGYATNETPDLMPVPISLAHRLAERLAAVRKDGTLDYLRPDGKTQVSVRYRDGRPVAIEKLLISTQHAEGAESPIPDDLWEHVVLPVLPAELYDADAAPQATSWSTRPAGSSSAARSATAGLTGRKIIVDTYGGFARHGGGAFSGKDPSKVDRSAAYAARWVAKNIVAAGLADRARCRSPTRSASRGPCRVMVETFGTEKIGRGRIAQLVDEHFDLRPGAFREELKLHRPIYQKTAAYGHFGRDRRGLHLGEHRPGGGAALGRGVVGMAVTVVGSIAFDAVKTPFGERARMLGGAATHFALAASFFDTVHVVGPVGEDFTDEDMAILATRGTDVSDVERVPGGKTFFWAGEYGWDLNTRETLDTQLNVFEHFQPKLSEASKAAEVLFLANIQPELQLEVREQCTGARFVAMDSMNLWIEIARDALVKVIERVDCVILNDAELRQLTGKPNVLTAAREIITWGPEVVVAKQGGYGAALITATDFFNIPAYPMEDVVDPTGAGDTFAGGFVGYIARHVDRRDRPRRAAQRDGLRHGDRVLQRRGVRHRAGRAADA